MTVSPELRTIGAPRQAPQAAPAPQASPDNSATATATAREASPDLLRSAFRRHAAGVAVITAHGERPVGFTATSLNSVSADPPLISFGVGTSSSSWPVLSEAEHIGVHVLGDHQRELAETFARSGADRFGAPTRWSVGPEGVPILDGVLAWLVCRVVARVPAGDHRIVIAEVVAADPTGVGRPLLYHQGRFNALRD
ncbi:flavin reductase family protein [Streptomyces sp. P9(2023)]|uniref:flavin reductase family protein n=1 Tax=Streptomyces sp. P9(2023) TaxID=3064394 RepID=UPI0028F44E55|nr:flavin reductase family protein [Streptomyces sp. P9(2023)]MDT9687475.1 flavin reductase family protein [Streptomyces sp. P9(2023)]